MGLFLLVMKNLSLLARDALLILKCIRWPNSCSDAIFPLLNAKHIFIWFCLNSFYFLVIINIFFLRIL
jgi:hypothetical protein